MRYLRFPQLAAEKGIDFSRMHIYRQEKAGKFPKRVQISDNTVGWIEEEIDAWQKAKVAARDHLLTEIAAAFAVMVLPLVGWLLVLVGQAVA